MIRYLQVGVPSSEVVLYIGEIPLRSCLPSKKNLTIEIWMAAPDRVVFVALEYGRKYSDREKLPRVHLPIGSDKESP